MQGEPRFKAPSRTFYGIEMFRGIAAVMVAIYHISRHYHKNFEYFPFSRITEFGHAGVDFFFVLSGFIILYIHGEDIGRPKQFYPYLAKRAARVYPFYWVVMFVGAALIPLIASASYPPTGVLVKQLLLWPIGMNDLIVGVSWTLQHEVLFYVVFGLLIIDRRLGAICLLAWFVLLIDNNYLAPRAIDYPTVLKAFNLDFFIGMSCAWLLQRRQISRGPALLVIGAIGFLATGCLEVAGQLDGYGGMARLLYGGWSALLIVGMVAWEQRGEIVVPGACRVLGRASYAIYLTHLLFFGIYYKIFSMAGVVASMPYWFSALVLLVLTACSAIAFSIYVELPLSRAVRRLLLGKTTRQVPSVRTSD